MDGSRVNRLAELRPAPAEPQTRINPHPTARRPIRIRIPSFPDFKPLEISDQYEIEQWVKGFPPYSDFNFVSLWSWNTSGDFEVSWLNDNLVVLFSDYGSGERFLSFLGINQAGDTADALLVYARGRGIVEELRLLPEPTARALPPRRGLTLEQVPEHDDYVLSTSTWSALAGGHFRNKRNEISRFERDHAPVCREIDLANPAVQQAVTGIFGRWVVQRERAGRQQTTTEALAVRRVFTLYRPGDLLAFGVFVDGSLVAYSINERLGNGYAMGHHWKADPAYSGAYPYLLRHTCRTLEREGIESLNIQQDLGESGLATAKRLYRPERLLHKYQVRAARPEPRLFVARDAPSSQTFDLGWMDGEHVG